MIDSKKVLYSKGKNDECHTPMYGVKPILKYAERFRGKIIWCPFDTEESEFVKVLHAHGHKVVFSHIDNGQDFYEYEPDEWDVIISNPPFTGKRQIFERVLSFNKPFALIMSNTWLNDSAPKQLFGNEMQLLMFEERMKFNNMDKITFSSSYFCWNFLPQQIICESLKQLKESK